MTLARRWLAFCLLFGGSLYLLSDRIHVTPSPVFRSRQDSLPKVPPRPHMLIQDVALGSHRSATERLTPGRVHRYTFTLKAGQLLHAEVEQDVVEYHSIDLAVQLYSPSGRKLFEIDSPTLSSGPEEIFLLADTPGDYKVVVDGLGGEGTYRLRVLSIHRASQSDRINAQAEKTFYQARELARLRPPRASEALAGFLEAELYWRDLGRPDRRAEAYRRAGALLLGQWEPKQALEFQRQALDLFRSTRNHNMEAAQLVGIGISLRMLGDLEAAEEHYHAAIQIARQYGYPEREANALLNLGILRHQRGDSWNALDSCEAALDLMQTSRKEPHEELAPLLLKGQVYVSLGKYQTALKQYEEALRVLGSRRAPDRRAEVLARISELYLNLGDSSRALAYARRALSYREQAGDLRGQAVSLAGISLILQQRGDLAQARALQEEALTVFHRIRDLSSESIAHLNLGHLWLAEADSRKALAHLKKAILLARQQGMKESEMAALYELARVEQLRKNPAAARRLIDEALKLLGSHTARRPVEELNVVYHDARQNGYGLLIDLLVGSTAKTTPPADVAASFEASEKARWQQLSNSLTPTRLRARVLKRANASLLAERQKLEDEINQVEKARLQLEWNGLPTLDAERTQKTLVESLHTLDVHLRRKDPWAANFDSPAPISLRDTQQLLDQDSVLLEYHLSEPRSFVWAVTPTSAEVFNLPSRAVIEEKARRLYHLLAESQWPANQEEALPLARDLSAILLGPVANSLRGSSIVVVPDGAIHLVPFAVLQDPTQTSRSWRNGLPMPLLLSHRVSYLPSASVLRAIRVEQEARQRQPGLLAVLADPNFADQNLPPLPLSRQEALRILALVPPKQKALKAFGDQASRELVMSGKLGEFQIVHFATHATNHPQHPQLSSLVLSQVNAQGEPKEGQLRLQNIQDLELPADLVVLSACKTALGKQVHGEGYMGLAQGFMYAGASRVLVSLWNVNEESTPKLMERFYRALLIEKRSPSEALRTAQRWLVEETPWSSPYYWAGFEIQGEWR